MTLKLSEHQIRIFDLLNCANMRVQPERSFAQQHLRPFLVVMLVATMNLSYGVDMCSFVVLCLSLQNEASPGTSEVWSNGTQMKPNLLRGGKKTKPFPLAYIFIASSTLLQPPLVEGGNPFLHLTSRVRSQQLLVNCGPIPLLRIDFGQFNIRNLVTCS